MPLTSDRYEASNDNLSKAPDQAGVYELYEAETIIYIGRAQGGHVTIRSRLKDHKAGRDGNCTKGYTHYRRVITNDPASVEVRELESHKRQHGKLPRCNERIG